ncbi:MAG: hypothetical protein JSS02_23215 [Planctomycetes bacterium]|nr:hypothetical protein [Planctomycetota bacterium]
MSLFLRFQPGAPAGWHRPLVRRCTRQTLTATRLVRPALKRHLASVFWALILTLGVCPWAVAQSSQVKLDLSSQSPPIRTNAPMTFVWRVESEAPTPITGQLSVGLFDGDTPITGIVDGVIITPGSQLIRTVLPPIDPQGHFDTPECQIHLLVDGKSIGAWRIGIPNGSIKQFQRRHIVAFCDAWSSSLPPGASKLLDQLRMESWNTNDEDRTITTFPARIATAELPEDPLGYCGFDMVVTAAEAFADLRERQLRALLDWVAAGGSFCAIPGTAVLKDYHVAALNQIAQAPPDQPRFVLDAAGRLTGNAYDAEAPGVLLKHFGLGRVAIFRGTLADLSDTRVTELRQAAGYLWKMRRDRRDEFLATGQFQLAVKKPAADPAAAGNPPTPGQPYGFNPADIDEYDKLRPTAMPLATLPLRSGDQLVARLMPEGLKIVPLSLIGLILFGYVILIGPTDWLALGAIRRRKWTWFTFPFVTIAVTLFTVWLAEWYMQVTDRRRTFTIQDMGVDNQVARLNRFEVLFQGSERDVTTQLNRELFADMNLQRFSSAFWQNTQIRRMQGQAERPLNLQMARYTGRIPGQYAVTQFISQWTPQLNRRFTIPRSKANTETEPAGPQFDWNKYADSATYRPDDMANNPQDPGRQTLLNDISQFFGAQTHVAIYHNGKRALLQRNFDFLQAEDVYGVDANGSPISAQRMYLGYSNPNRPSFLDDISMAPHGGLFSVGSQSSPNGGRDFEDLSLADPSDPDQWLLVIGVADRDDVDIYRKLYHKGE